MRARSWPFSLVALLLSAALVGGPGCDRVGHSGDLDLTWEDFDQNPDRGWRPLAAREEFEEAALLIEAYLLKHADLPAGQQSFLHFHAGQLLALDGLEERAISHIEAADIRSWPEDTPRSFPHLARGTLAFLRQDAAGVERARQAAASLAGPTDRDREFLEALELLVAHPELSYQQVYQLAIQ